MAFIDKNYGEIKVDKQVNVDLHPQEDATKEKSNRKGNTHEGQFTIQQLIILFDSLLNVPLNPQNTNIKAVSELIAKVSGYDSESIRAKLNESLDFDKHQTRLDAETLASLLDKIKPELARILRNEARD